MAGDEGELAGEADGDAAEAALGADATAALVLETRRNRQDAPADPRMDAFLDQQTRLLALQAEHLHEQRTLQLEHLRRRRWKDRLALGVQLAGVLAALAIVTALGAAAWIAHDQTGIVVQAFETPPAYAGRGLSGRVLALQVMDRLRALSAAGAAGSISRAKKITDDDGSGIKLEIPETGVSVSEIWRLLKTWLGHERVIGGDLTDLGDGRLSLTVRLSGEDARTFTGPAADLAQLEQQAAEALFAATDPGNYVIYLDNTGRHAEALKTVQAQALAESPNDGADSDAYSLWANLTVDPRLSLERARMALSMYPTMFLAHREAYVALRNLGDDEAALAEARVMADLREGDQQKLVQGAPFAGMVARNRLYIDQLLGDYRAGLPLTSALNYSLADEALVRAQLLAWSHDPTGAAAQTQRAIAAGGPRYVPLPVTLYRTAMARGDWREAVAHARSIAASDADTVAKALPEERAAVTATNIVSTNPLLATALAKAGDLTGAQATADAMPMDCYACLRARAVVAEARGDLAAAEVWLEKAAARAPSLPFAETDLAELRLKRNDPVGALAAARAAMAKGPLFADAHEVLGEALLTGGDRAAAASQFKLAAGLAPAWAKPRRALAALSEPPP